MIWKVLAIPALFLAGFYWGVHDTTVKLEGVKRMATVNARCRAALERHGIDPVKEGVYAK